MLDWLVYQIPWYVWAVLGVIVAVAVQRFFGWRNAIMAAIGIGAAVLLHRSRQQGYRDRVNQEREEREELRDEYDQIDSDGRGANDAYDRLRDRSER